jgi:sec-independent protein translocase protein TatA
MGSLSIWHLLILLALVVILFGGGGKLSRIMGDFGKGITSFKAGLREAERKDKDSETRDSIDHAPPGPTIEGSVRQDEAVRR